MLNTEGLMAEKRLQDRDHHSAAILPCFFECHSGDFELEPIPVASIRPVV
jgi:hypothetical protein